MMRPISVQLSSTIEKDDLWRAVKMLRSPSSLINGSAVGQVESWFKKTFGFTYTISFNSARAALFAILKCSTIGQGDEVILQAFTCVVVPNAILWTGAKPVYVDIDKNGFIMSISDLEKKITKRTRAIIIQHTFGYPDNLDQIVKIARQHRLLLIEDCAHSLGNQYQGKLLGTLADAAIFSFGRDKVVSSVFGGITLTKDKKLARALLYLHNQLPYPSTGWIIQQLLHPLLFALLLPWYQMGVGKVLLILLQRLNLLSKPVSHVEYETLQPALYPRKYANALAYMTLGQLQKLEYLQNRRKQAASLYWQNLTNIEAIELPPKTNQALLRFPILVSDAKALIQKAKKAGIILGDWYGNVIDPKGCDRRKAGYEPGLCPNAEDKARAVVNLPTAPVLSNKEILEVIHFIKNFYGHH